LLLIIPFAAVFIIFPRKLITLFGTLTQFNSLSQQIEPIGESQVSLSAAHLKLGIDANPALLLYLFTGETNEVNNFNNATNSK